MSFAPATLTVRLAVFVSSRPDPCPRPQVVPESPAAKAGIIPDDQIEFWNGTKVDGEGIWKAKVRVPFLPQGGGRIRRRREGIRRAKVRDGEGADLMVEKFAAKKVVRKIDCLLSASLSICTIYRILTMIVFHPTPASALTLSPTPPPTPPPQMAAMRIGDEVLVGLHRNGRDQQVHPGGGWVGWDQSVVCLVEKALVLSLGLGKPSILRLLPRTQPDHLCSPGWGVCAVRIFPLFPLFIFSHNPICRSTQAGASLGPPIARAPDLKLPCVWKLWTSGCKPAPPITVPLPGGGLPRGPPDHRGPPHPLVCHRIQA